MFVMSPIEEVELRDAVSARARLERAPGVVAAAREDDAAPASWRILLDDLLVRLWRNDMPLAILLGASTINANAPGGRDRRASGLGLAGASGAVGLAFPVLELEDWSCEQ